VKKHALLPYYGIRYQGSDKMWGCEDLSVVKPITVFTDLPSRLTDMDSFCIAPENCQRRIA